jgi:hypothetical protein
MRQTLNLVVIVGFGLLWSSCCTRAPSPPSESARAAPATMQSASGSGVIDWSRYPRTEAFDAFRRAYDSPGGALSLTSVARPLLAVIWFIGQGDRVAYVYEVREDGQESDWREVYNWAQQSNRSRKLTTAELRELAGAVASLPPSASPPPLERLVIVKRQAGGEWRTDIYDAASLPPAMESVMRIIGGRQ